jgi:DivIVA domain-containing protein
MELKLDLTAKKILDKKFAKDVKGYNPSEVDAFLDRVIQDYLAFNQYQKQIETSKAPLEEQINAFQSERQKLIEDKNAAVEAKRALEIENASLRKKLDGIKPGDKPTAENMEYISRINALEDFLYSIGYDPRTLKKKSE